LVPLASEYQLSATDLVSLDPVGHERMDDARPDSSAAEDSIAPTRLLLDRDVAAGLGERRCKLNCGHNVGRLH
jgi:hypothetical protein